MRSGIGKPNSCSWKDFSQRPIPARIAATRLVCAWPKTGTVISSASPLLPLGCVCGSNEPAQSEFLTAWIGPVIHQYEIRTFIFRLGQCLWGQITRANQGTEIAITAAGVMLLNGTGETGAARAPAAGRE